MGEGLVDKLQGEPGLDMQVTWLPFELHPETPTPGADIGAFLGIPPARLQQSAAALRARAAELGLPLTEGRRLVNSHNALLLAEWTRQQAPARFLAIHRALFRAYFAAGRNLAEADVLRDVYADAKASPPADAALAQMHDPAYEQRLAESMALARRYGVTGVPAFIINNRYMIAGAQPYDVLLQALRQIAQK